MYWNHQPPAGRNLPWEKHRTAFFLGTASFYYSIHSCSWISHPYSFRCNCKYYPLHFRSTCVKFQLWILHLNILHQSRFCPLMVSDWSFVLGPFPSSPSISSFIHAMKPAPFSKTDDISWNGIRRGDGKWLAELKRATPWRDQNFIVQGCEEEWINLGWPHQAFDSLQLIYSFSKYLISLGNGWNT